MANIITWALLGLTIGGLMNRLLHAAHLPLNLAAGAAICIAAGLILAPMMELALPTFTLALLGLALALVGINLFNSPQKATDD